MKKKVLFIGIVIVLLVVISFLVISNKSNTIQLVYETNGGAPYGWQYKIKDKNIVKFVKSYVIEDENKNGRVGAPIKTKYVFKGLKEGKTTIVFKKVSVTDNTVYEKDVVKVKVDKNKRIFKLDN